MNQSVVLKETKPIVEKRGLHSNIFRLIGSKVV